MEEKEKVECWMCGNEKTSASSTCQVCGYWGKNYEEYREEIEKRREVQRKRASKIEMLYRAYEETRSE